jgi:hypothetical protein
MPLPAASSFVMPIDAVGMTRECPVAVDRASGETATSNPFAAARDEIVSRWVKLEAKHAKFPDDMNERK